MAKCAYGMKELAERKAVITVYDVATEKTVDVKVLACKFPGVEVQLGRRKEVIAALALPWLKISFPEETNTRKVKAGAGRRGR